MPAQVVVELIAPGRKNRPGTPLKPLSITIHNTDNPNAGAGAVAHSKFIRNTGYYMLNGKQHWISWHYVVDDKFIIQNIPVSEQAWHAGPGNASSIGIEICMNAGMNAAAAYQNAAALVATMVNDLGLKASDIVTHESWTGKHCPSVLLQGDNWQKFINLIAQNLSGHGLAPLVTGLDADDFAIARQNEPLPDIDHDLLLDAITAAEDE